MGHLGAPLARDCPARSTLLFGRGHFHWFRRVLRDPLLAGQLCGRLNDIAMPLLSLNLGSGFSVDSVCHLRDRPALAFHRTFYELFSNAPYFADALRIVLLQAGARPVSQSLAVEGITCQRFNSLLSFQRRRPSGRRPTAIESGHARQNGLMKRRALGGSELDDICAVSLRAKDHDPVLAGGGHRSRSLSRSR